MTDNKKKISLLTAESIFGDGERRNGHSLKDIIGFVEGYERIAALSEDQLNRLKAMLSEEPEELTLTVRGCKYIQAGVEADKAEPMGEWSLERFQKLPKTELESMAGVEKLIDAIDAEDRLESDREAARKLRRQLDGALREGVGSAAVESQDLELIRADLEKVRDYSNGADTETITEALSELQQVERRLESDERVATRDLRELVIIVGSILDRGLRREADDTLRELAQANDRDSIDRLLRARGISS